MRFFKHILFATTLLVLVNSVFGIDITSIPCVDKIYSKNIKTVRMHLQDWEVSYPVMELGSEVGLLFSFDQIESQPEDYYYTVQHCTYDWQPSNILFMDYADGFEENEIIDYEDSHSTYVQYTHFTLNLPNDYLNLKLSGNYLLIIYTKEPVERVVCTKRFMVYENIVEVTGRVNSNILSDYRTDYQKVDFAIIRKSYNIYNPIEELKVVLMQNYQWQNAFVNMRPSFIADDRYTFDWDDKYVFNAANEFRYFSFNNLDIGSEFIDRIEYHKPYYYVDLLPEKSKYFDPYSSVEDINGNYVIRTSRRNESDFPEVQAEYGILKFKLKSNMPISNADVYIYGGISGYEFSDMTKMEYNAETRCYEKLMFLKQGYYNYQYLVIPRDNTSASIDRMFFEGSHKETENDYLLFVYHRNPSESYDRLINYTKFNSRN